MYKSTSPYIQHPRGGKNVPFQEGYWDHSRKMLSDLIRVIAFMYSVTNSLLKIFLSSACKVQRLGYYGPNEQ